MIKKRLVLFDGNAILHRAYWAFPTTLTTKQGELVNAVYGFSKIVLRVLTDLKPAYVICAFDLPGPNFRHREFIGYQAQRPKMEADLVSQVDRVHQVVRALDIPIFTKNGYEADDVLGTLANLAKNKKAVEVVIVTGDKDILQLVDDRVKVLIPSQGFANPTLFGPKKVKEVLKVSPQQVVDFKALTGDSSDNYPGVPGIGPKTAQQLLTRFPSLEAIYDNLDKIDNQSVRNKLENGKDSAFLSQKLARIVTDLQLKFDLKKARFQDKDNQQTIDLFEQLGFRSLLKKPQKIGSENNQMSLI